jgi:hypothetical protein
MARARLRAGERLSYLVKTPARTHIRNMLNILSVLIGLSSLLFILPGVFPLLGALNWLAIPITIVGGVIGMLSSRNTGRNLNLVLLVVAILRLSLGGGIL